MTKITKSSARYSNIDMARGLFLILVTWVHMIFFVGGASLGEIFWAGDLPRFQNALNYLLWVVGEQISPCGFFILLGMGIVFYNSRQATINPDFSASVSMKHFFKRGLALIILGILINPIWLLGPQEAIKGALPGPIDERLTLIVFGIFFQLGACMIITSFLANFRSFIICSIIVVIAAAIYFFIPNSSHFHDRYNPFLIMLFIPGKSGIFQSTFTTIPWLIFTLAGVLLGRLYLISQSRACKIMTLTSIIMLLLFILIRFLNLGLDPRAFNIQDLTTLFYYTKYPPFIACVLLGIAMTCLITCFIDKIIRIERLKKILLVFGTNSLPAYAAHFFLYAVIGRLIFLFKGSYVQGMTMYFIWIIGLFILYFFCTWYQKVKIKHKNSILQYL